MQIDDPGCQRQPVSVDALSSAAHVVADGDYAAALYRYASRTGRRSQAVDEPSVLDYEIVHPYFSSSSGVLAHHFSTRIVLYRGPARRPTGIGALHRMDRTVSTRRMVWSPNNSAVTKPVAVLPSRSVLLPFREHSDFSAACVGRDARSICVRRVCTLLALADSAQPRQ